MRTHTDMLSNSESCDVLFKFKMKLNLWCYLISISSEQMAFMAYWYVKQQSSKSFVLTIYRLVWLPYGHALFGFDGNEKWRAELQFPLHHTYDQLRQQNKNVSWRGTDSMWSCHSIYFTFTAFNAIVVTMWSHANAFAQY